VPWARHDDGSPARQEFAAWNTAHMAWTRASAERRISWQGLAGIVSPVAADATVGTDRLEGLRWIGIDEKSWDRGSGRFLVIVTDHDTGRVAWIGQGRDQVTMHAFFDALGEDRAKLLAQVSADGAEWIHPVVRARAAEALICLDAFHIVSGQARNSMNCGPARPASCAPPAATTRPPPLGKDLWALRKKPPNLTGSQRTVLAGIAADKCCTRATCSRSSSARRSRSRAPMGRSCSAT